MLRQSRRCLQRHLLRVRRQRYLQYTTFPSVLTALSLSWRGCCGCGSHSPRRIDPESIVVETVVEAASHHDTIDVHVVGPHNTHGGESDESTHVFSTVSALGHFQDVESIDAFARGRVANYARRMGQQPAQLYATRTLGPDERESFLGGATSTVTGEVFLAQMRVPLPAPHGSYLAEGLAETAKDAELLAAMHAEQVCDALGVPLYALPSMQRKHAEAVRRRGRYAPLPGDPVRPEGTAVPPPLRMIAFAGAVAAAAAAATEARGADSHHHHSVPPVSGHGGHHHHHNSRLSGHRFTVLEAELVGHAAAFPTKASSSSSISQAPRRGLQRVSEIRSTAATTMTPIPCAETQSNDDVTQTASSSSSWKYTDVAWYPWLHTRTPQEVLAEEGEDDLPPDELFAMVDGLGHTPAASSSVQTRSSGRPRPSLASMARALQFDPTEGGLWQMVQTLATRCSPTPEDALVLPYVYDGSHALARMRDHYHQHNASLDDHLSITHVPVPRHSARMYVAELRLINVHASVTAKGKAQTKEVALNLAAMHAELLLDAMGHPLFPRDPVRQRRHAAAVKRYGRWACGDDDEEVAQVTQDSAVSTPRPASTGAVSVSGLAGDALPTPLKQQIGGDDVWLSLVRPHESRHARSEGERIVALHNVLNHHYSDALEVNLPLDDHLEQAPAILRQWQLNMAQSAYPELYVLTRLGDAYRATTLTPVPRCYGVRGGNAIGKTMAQAVQLCALHALDTLCALGIPIYKDPVEQRAYMQWRREHGFVTADRMRGLRRPAFVVPLKHSVLAVDAADGEDNPTDAHTTTTRADSTVPLFVTDALSTVPGTALPHRRPYLPSYIAEGSAVRMPPRIADTLLVLQLDIPEHFNVFGFHEPNETLRVEMGNAARVCVHNYIQHQHAAYASALRQHHQEHGEPKSRACGAVADAQAPEEATLWWRQWLASPPLLLPHVFITGYTKQVSVYNFAYMRLPLPLSQTTLKAVTFTDAPAQAPPSLLALGLALKKKDAERMCYLHAAAMLQALTGEDVIQRYPVGLPRQGGITSYTAHLQPHITSFDTPLKEKDTAEATTGDVDYCRPLMYATMKTFLGSGKYYTPRRSPHSDSAVSASSFTDV